MGPILRILPSISFLLAAFALESCQVMPFQEGASRDGAESPVSIEVMEAEASLHRVEDPDGAEDLAPDFYMLRTTCVVRVNNRSGKDQKVLSYFGTAFDDLRLRVRDEDGRRLATTTHTLWADPLLEGKWFSLVKGTSVVELSSATLVGPPIPDDDYPVINAKDLTQTIQLEFFGGFPGSDFSRGFQSSKVTVRIADRTAEVPRKPVPLPQDHV